MSRRKFVRELNTALGYSPESCSVYECENAHNAPIQPVMNKLHALILGACLAGNMPAHAVIFQSTSDSSYNTSAPTGPLASSGWQYEGQWGSYLGTAIAPNYFITAKHVGGGVGMSFTYQGSSYITTAQYSQPNSDLQIWQVSGTFSTYAPLYSGNGELNQNLVVIGRGTQRGADVLVGGDLKGWGWGAADTVQRWGENQVSQIGDFQIGLGNMLRATFELGAGPNEATLSVGDSGGAVFIQDGGVWKLAGINYGVDGPYKYSAADATSFNAAIFDQSGLYGQTSPTTWDLITSTDPGALYSSRISDQLTWINSVVPEPSEWALASTLGLLLFGLGRKWVGVATVK